MPKKLVLIETECLCDRAWQTPEISITHVQSSTEELSGPSMWNRFLRQDLWTNIIRPLLNQFDHQPVFFLSWSSALWSVSAWLLCMCVCICCLLCEEAWKEVNHSVKSLCCENILTAYWVPFTSTCTHRNTHKSEPCLPEMTDKSSVET